MSPYTNYMITHDLRWAIWTSQNTIIVVVTTKMLSNATLEYAITARHLSTYSTSAWMQ